MTKKDEFMGPVAYHIGITVHTMLMQVTWNHLIIYGSFRATSFAQPWLCAMLLHIEFNEG